VDVEPAGFMMDPVAVEDAVTSRTKAIVPVHLFGQAANMSALQFISERHGIPIIEDAAQAIGTQVANGTRVGSIGAIGCFSFYPTKNLGAFGDAGLLTTNNDALAVQLRQMRNHGMEPRYYHKFIGGNFRLDSLQAAVLRVKLPHLPAWHAARRANAALYERLFVESGLSKGAGHSHFTDGNTVLLPASLDPGVAEDHHIYNQYTIRVQDRDGLRSHLQHHGIGTEIYYPVPFHRQQCFDYIGSTDDAFPVTNELCSTVLSLPIYPELTSAQIEEVVATVLAYQRTTAPS
jgi:dTDP-4-amino-4,6-dideoxygalactose transaminase